MIISEHQARVTKNQIRNFEQAINDFEQTSTTTDAIMRLAERAALVSQLEVLKEELAEYIHTT